MDSAPAAASLSSRSTRGEKRRSGEVTSPQSLTHTRSKRNRYISIACNECKRRKIKCNGQTPCQRCGNLNLECLYAPNCCSSSLKDSEEFRHLRDTVTALQEQVTVLWDIIHDHKGQHVALSAAEPVYPAGAQGDAANLDFSRRLPPLISPKKKSQKPLPQFHGPTSSTYGIGVARSSLQTMGITPSLPEDDVQPRSQSRPVSPVRQSSHPSYQMQRQQYLQSQPSVLQQQSQLRPPSATQLQLTHLRKDPLWQIERAEAKRLLQCYDEEVQDMYPIVNLDKLRTHVDVLHTFMDSTIRSNLTAPDLRGENLMNDDQTLILKMVLSCCLIMEGTGKSELGQNLFDSAKLAIDILLVGELSLVTIQLVTLTSTFYFQKGEETQAWRFIGMAVRLCLEMGLHRQETLLSMFATRAELREPLRVFWAVYALDRRWSFGTGMPFALQDADIDPNLPEPDDEDQYLKYMTRHNKLSTKIWQHVSLYDAGAPVKNDEIGFLDYQVVQWYDSLPERLKFFDQDLARENKITSRQLRRLRFITYLRKNQSRLSIYRPIMHSATSIMQNRQYAEQIVSVAKDTINTITGVNRTSDTYSTQQVMYNYFLVQALAVIFLAVAHAPAIFIHSTREEFYAAIDLIKGFSTRSYTSRKLWKTIRGLREIGDKICMLDKTGIPLVPQMQDVDANADTVAAMAEISGAKMNSYMYDDREGSQGDGLSVSPDNAQQMSNELSALFELAGASVANGTEHPDQHQQQAYAQYIGLNPNGAAVGGGGDSYIGFTGNEPEVMRVINDLF